jgi:hypothetical protein
VRVSEAWSNKSAFTMTIDPVKGSYPGMPKTRSYEFRIAGVLPAGTITLNGVKVAKHTSSKQAGWMYDGTSAELRVRSAEFPTDGEVRIDIEGLRMLPEKAADLRGRIARYKRVMPVLNNLWPEEWSPESLVRAAQTGNRMTLWPERAEAEILALEAATAKIINDIDGMKIPAEVKAKALGHLR